jgi:putative nucleotidyltransferase with HDIG domain
MRLWPSADELRIQRDDWRRVGILLLVCALVSLLVVDWAHVPTETLQAGEVASRTVKASHTFQYTDFARQEDLLEQARESVSPVYVHRADLSAQLETRIREAFAAGRAAGRDDVQEAFRSALGVHVPDEDVDELAQAGFPGVAEELAVSLVQRGMRGYVVADRAELPADRRPIRVIELRGSDRQEYTVDDPQAIRTPEEAREQVSFGRLDAKQSAAWADAAATVARASVRPNLSFDAIETRERQDAAAAQVPASAMTVKRGTTLFRKGDVLSASDVERYSALQRTATGHKPWVQLVAVGAFLVLLFTSLYHFGASWLDGFSTRVRDVAALGALLLVTAVFARLTVASAEDVAALIGMDAEATSVWFVVPVAGAAILVRLLVGVGATVVFSIAAAAVCGLVMDLQAIPVVYFVLSSLVGAGSIDHTRERLAVLRSGVYIGVLGAATVLLLHFLQIFVGDGEVGLEVTIRPFWSMLFAFAGGVGSGFLVLGLLPVFESVGFVTDYRLLELANLNHPLMRQLMLRAPGSYHHSVVVGTLAEAACDAVGANALQARVAAYFHDIGKALKPQYFIENQRNSPNRHTSLDAHTSARVIINHVIDGGRMAREHKLPQPIIDNIYMHHGTGILQYFYTQALANAEDPSTVDEAQFRYPGPKPNNREAGIIMLADKVEAATRTIQEPSEERFRSMIHSIINSVMADGQFEECPLTFQEISTIAETFVQVLLGIHHQRIEYPATRNISRGITDAGARGQGASEAGEAATPERKPASTGNRGSVITLEIPSPLKARSTGTDGRAPSDEDEDTSDPDTDYESLKNLPGSGGS